MLKKLNKVEAADIRFINFQGVFFPISYFFVIQATAAETTKCNWVQESGKMKEESWKQIKRILKLIVFLSSAQCIDSSVLLRSQKGLHKKLVICKLLRARTNSLRGDDELFLFTTHFAYPLSFYSLKKNFSAYQDFFSRDAISYFLQIFSLSSTM